MQTHYANVWQDGMVRSTQPEYRFIVDDIVLVQPSIEKAVTITIGRRAAACVVNAVLRTVRCLSR
jgi:hypothetical protein